MPENSLRVVARIKALPDKVDEARAILLELIEPTRGEPGCITYDLLQNKSDPTDFAFVEEWEDRMLSIRTPSAVTSRMSHQNCET